MKFLPILIFGIFSFSLSAQTLNATKFAEYVEGINAQEIQWEHEKKKYEDGFGTPCGLFCDDSFKSLTTLANNVHDVASFIVTNQKLGTGINSESLTAAIQKTQTTNQDFLSFFAATKAIIAPYPELWNRPPVSMGTSTPLSPEATAAESTFLTALKDNSELIKNYKMLQTFQGQLSSMAKFKCDLEVLNKICYLPPDPELQEKIESMVTSPPNCDVCDQYSKSFLGWIEKLAVVNEKTSTITFKVGGYQLGHTSIEPLGVGRSSPKTEDDIKLLLCHLVQFQESGDCNGLPQGYDYYQTMVEKILVNTNTEQLTKEDCQRHGLLKNFESSLLPIKRPEIFAKPPYPNPVVDTLTLEISPAHGAVAESLKMEILDSSGKIVQMVGTESGSETVKTLSFSHLPSGIYYLSVYDEKSKTKKTFKIVK